MNNFKKLIIMSNQIEDAIEKLPYPYILCEYISCTGRQYIDLGYKLGYNDKIELDIHPDSFTSSGLRSPFGYDNYSGDYGFDLKYRSDSSTVITFGNALTRSVKLNNRCKLSISKTGVWKNGTFHPWDNTPSDFTSGGNIYIGTSNRNGGAGYMFSGKIHEVKVFENGSMSHRYVPALNSDTMIAGLYDIVTGMFLPNTSSSTFGYLVKGSAIPYLEFIAIEEELQVSFSKNDIQYSFDRKKWKTLPTGDTSIIHRGKSIYFRANISPDGTDTGIGRFTCVGKYNIQGTPLSLLYADECFGKSTLPSVDYCFAMLFSGTDVVKILNPKDFLPATTLASYCYSRMFQDCKNLENAVFLPALVLKGFSYYYMYSGCSSLTETFDFPKWTSVSLSAASYMFYNCTSLKKQPKLTSTIVGQSMCEYMFAGCTSLEEAQDILPAVYVYNRCYINMYNGCTSLAKAPEIPAIVDGNTGYSMYNMFTNCTSLKTPPPELKLLNLTGSTYYGMFRGCTSLEESPIIHDTIIVENSSYSLREMFRGCKNLKKITYLINKAPSATNGYSTSWTSGVASEGLIILNKNIEWNPDDYRGVNGIPAGWTVKYCDPDNIDDVRDYREIDQPW